MEHTQTTSGGCRSQANQTGGFFHKLTPAAMQDLNTMQFPSSYAANVVIFSEKDAVEGLYVVLEGEVPPSRVNEICCHIV